MNDKRTIIIAEYFKSKGQVLNLGIPAHRVLFKRNLRSAKELLDCTGGDVQDAVSRIHKVAAWARSNRLSYSLETITKRFFEDNTPTQRPYIIEHGKRYEARNRNEQWEILDNGRWYKFSGRKSEIKYE